MMNWEKFGLRIGVSEGGLSSEETAKVAVFALSGGQFVFPADTILVSAVYKISVSRSLFKPLRLEIQHCVDLKSAPTLNKRLKFAIAPTYTSSHSYRFTVVKGGEFPVDSQYGLIERNEFCLVCILGEDNGKNGSTNGSEGEQQQEDNGQEGGARCGGEGGNGCDGEEGRGGGGEGGGRDEGGGEASGGKSGGRSGGGETGAVDKQPGGGSHDEQQEKDTPLQGVRDQQEQNDEFDAVDYNVTDPILPVACTDTSCSDLPLKLYPCKLYLYYS